MIKDRIKTLRKQLFNAYAERYLRFTVADLEAALGSAGVRTGDVLFIHSSLDAFAGFQGTVVDIIAMLQKMVGPEGTLLMPQQPFSGSAIQWAESGKVFDVRRTPTRMGLLPEMFRRTAGVVRSIHPTHSVAAWGAGAQSMIADHAKAESPCGFHSPYMRLFECRGKILHLGSRFATTTFVHAADELLRDHIPFSPLTEQVYPMKVRDQNGAEHDVPQRLFDMRYGKVRNPERLLPELRRRGLLREARISRLNILALETASLVDTMRALAGQKFYYYDLDALKS